MEYLQYKRLPVEEKPTPGPWWVGYFGPTKAWGAEGSYQIRTANGIHIATTYAFGQTLPEVAQKNASLICAAPDLLAACLLALDALGPHCQLTREILQSAIDKAQGETS